MTQIKIPKKLVKIKRMDCDKPEIVNIGDEGVKANASKK